MIDIFEKLFSDANVLLESSDFDSAATLYTQILASEPDNARALHALGVVMYRGWGNAREAVKLIRKSLALRCDYADAYNNLARILQECGRPRSAIACYQQVLVLNPNDTDAWINLGTIYFLEKKPEEALSAFQDAIKRAPDSFDAVIGIARALIEMKQYHEALVYFSKAQDLAPDDPVVYYGSALAHKQLDQIEQSKLKLLHALELKPDYAEAYRGLAEVMLSLGDAQSAVEIIRKALTFKPDFKDAYTFLLYAIHYPSTSTQKDVFDVTVEFCNRFLSGVPRISNHQNDRRTDRQLKIGYISGEFNRHPVGFFFELALAYHDTERISTYCYSNGPVTDWLTDRLKSYATVWHNISGLSDETVTRQIVQDEIDILVDLSGLIGFGRIGVMARKPAPVQVSWIGYYNTSGLDTIDYIIMDSHTLPVGMVPWFTERVVYMPETRFCYTPPPTSFVVKPLPAINNGYITFGCFNNISKLSSEIIAVWSNVLLSIPDSLLVLKWSSFNDESVVERFKAIFEQHGINSSRVEYRKASDYGTLLEEYGDIDIALDSFPFSGATTSCEALWMGVPVITMPGPLPAGRQTLALLKIIGLHDYIADSNESYVELALRHATDLKTLSSLRQRLREMVVVSPLCDGQRFTTELESAYRLLWQRWCEGVDDKNDRSPIEILPSVPEIAYNKGVGLLAEKRLLESKRFFEQAIALNPEFTEALNNLGIVDYYLGDLEGAEIYLDKAVMLRPVFVEALNNLGRVLTALKKDKKAIRIFSEVITLEPFHYQAWNNLGELYRNVGRIAKARACFRKALCCRSDFIDAHNNLSTLYLQYDAVKSYNIYKVLIENNPMVADLKSNYIFAMHYRDSFSREDIYSNICKFGEMFDKSYPNSEQIKFLSKSTINRVLKIGFVSADFHQHPGGVFFQALARYHDSSQFSFICYDNSGKRDVITDDIQRHTELWRTVSGTTDDELLTLIKSDEIDILIDLSGHTSGHRLPVFARKPAPVQASWLGWFNTTGIKAIDYLIVDRLMVKEGEEHFFIEKPVYLPHVRFCYTPPFLCPDVEILPAKTNGHVTFGCFNNLAKISERVINVWAGILDRVPRSRLVLKSPSFRDFEMRQRYLKRFMAHGISVDRVELRQQSLHFFMMSEYNDIDIALDPFPYCGGLTSCESLWMGVPVVTLPGERPVSRQTESFLNAVELPECIARDETEYIQRACNLAADFDNLQKIRTGLRDKMVKSSLCDGRQFAIDFGDVLHKIWFDNMVTL